MGKLRGREVPVGAPAFSRDIPGGVGIADGEGEPALLHCARYRAAWREFRPADETQEIYFIRLTTVSRTP